MCFDWSRWVEGSELDGLEHVVRAFGPILAPSRRWDPYNNGNGGMSAKKLPL
jgi:hypothetical protein